MRKLNFDLVFITIALIIACAGMGRMHINSIRENPDQYSNKQVAVSGKVVQIFALPFIDQGICKIDDGTGEIWVKPAGRVPAKGETIHIKGTVKIGLNIAHQNFGLIIIEKKPEEE
jgi:hypothetical protein